MHTHTIDDHRHDHAFLGGDHARNERRAQMVIALTFIMMVAEVAAGMAFGSMALLADGMHMATHAGALALSAAPTPMPGATSTTRATASARERSAI